MRYSRLCQCKPEVRFQAGEGAFSRCGRCRWRSRHNETVQNLQKYEIITST